MKTGVKTEVGLTYKKIKSQVIIIIIMIIKDEKSQITIRTI